MKSQMMSPCSHRRQKGLTLIELLIALALIAFFTFLIFGRGNEAQTRADVSAERDFVQSLLPSIRGLKDGASYAAVSTQTLINSGTVDRSRINGTDLVNTQAGVMTVAPGNWNGGTNNAFVVTNPGLPRAICTAVGQGFGFCALHTAREALVFAKGSGKRVVTFKIVLSDDRRRVGCCG